MEDLLEKIRFNANKRLNIPIGKDFQREIQRFRNFLKVENHRLKIFHRSGGSGIEVCRARAFVVDELFRYLIKALSKVIYGKEIEFDELPFALVANGGYGRSELNPYSDIDIMFLHNLHHPNHPQLKPWVDIISRGVFFDLGLKVMHTLRSIDDCIQIANSDILTKTSLMESRLILGDSELFDKFQKELYEKCIRGREDDYIRERIADQAARRAKYGNSATMQEPNIKNGCGGLRDFQNLRWMVLVKYRVNTLDEMAKQELISVSEKKALEEAYDFLLKVRTELHYQVGRQMDVLIKRYQPSVAYRLGFKDLSPSRRIEEFMSQLYKHTRNIYLITKNTEERLALLPQKNAVLAKSVLGLITTKVHIFDGFKIENNAITYANSRVFDDQPRRLMRIFLYSRQRGIPIHPELIQLIRRKIHLVQRQFQADPHVGETFMQILNERGNVAPYLRQMHEVGLLGKYLPEFGRLTNLVQHEFYHQYTLDEHTLMCIEKIDAIWTGKTNVDKFYTALMKDIEKPYLLYLAMLLHDIGKGAGAPRGKHASVGANLSYAVAKRIGLEETDAETLRFLVENHLYLAEFSQRRNIDDPAEISMCAKKIKNGDNLRILTILTVADTLGTSERLWNGYKDQLLQTLFIRCDNLYVKSLNSAETQILDREKIVKSLLQKLPPHHDEEAVRIHLKNLPVRYIYSQSIQQITTDLNLVYEFLYNQAFSRNKALYPVISWHNESNKGFGEVKICTWDRTGLFAKIAGSLTASGLNILSAHIFTREDGIAIDTFYVTDLQSGKCPTKKQREKFEDILKQILTATGDKYTIFPEKLISEIEHEILKQRQYSPYYQVTAEERIPTQISFINDVSDNHTVIEIVTEDRIGLLYLIAKTFRELKLDLSIAKISTEKGAAIDSFYVSKTGGGKIISPEEQQYIKSRLLKVLEENALNSITKS